MIQAERVDFVGVPVRDLARADEFYGKTLGLERGRNSGEQWVEYETGNVTLALVQEAFLPGGFKPVPVIAIRVPDVAAARAKLRRPASSSRARSSIPASATSRASPTPRATG